MIAPQIPIRLSLCDVADRVFPAIRVGKSAAVHDAAAREAEKTGLQVSQSLSEIFAKAVLPSLEGIFWKERHHVEHHVAFTARRQNEAGRTPIDLADVLPIDKAVELFTDLIVKSGATPKSPSKR